MHDVIIVLARGIDKEGVLQKDTIARVKKGVELYNTHAAPRLLMSGRWSFHFDAVPPLTEAEAMKRLAIELGVPEGAVLTEDQSVDTITNVYLTKKIFCEPNNFKNIIIVASDEHMPRIKYLFQKIYGDSYSFTFAESERVIDDGQYAKEAAHESSSLATTKKWFDRINDGDDAAVHALLTEYHPIYSQGQK